MDRLRIGVRSDFQAFASAQDCKETALEAGVI